MKGDIQETRQDGFSLAEVLVSMLVLLPVMGAAAGLFSVAVNQHSSEQSSVEVNQDARAAFELMTLEIAQAGSHGDLTTTTSAPISTPSSAAQTVSVTSSAGFGVGDYVNIDPSGNPETITLTAVGTNSISGIFRRSHGTSVPVRLFALPFTTGVIPPAGLGANSSASVTKIKFYGTINGFVGDENGDGTLYYIEYNYDSANAQITRSMTPITQTSKNSALPLVRNVKAGSVQFTLYTDSHAVVTSVSLTLVVHNTWKTGSKYQETALSSRIAIPSAAAASALYAEAIQYGGPNNLPPTPPQVTTWANQ